jgi:hypothetical protein
VARRGLREAITYQSPSRYWRFQLTETAIYLTWAPALAGYCFRRLSHFPEQADATTMPTVHHAHQQNTALASSISESDASCFAAQASSRIVAQVTGRV